MAKCHNRKAAFDFERTLKREVEPAAQDLRLSRLFTEQAYYHEFGVIKKENRHLTGPRKPPSRLTEVALQLVEQAAKTPQNANNTKLKSTNQYQCDRQVSNIYQKTVLWRAAREVHKCKPRIAFIEDLQPTVKTPHPTHTHHTMPNGATLKYPNVPVP